LQRQDRLYSSLASSRKLCGSIVLALWGFVFVAGRIAD
jgi:hypothetical protein